MATITAKQLKTLAIVPKFSSSLSMLGSAWIIMEVLIDRKKMSHVYHRMLLVMSISDVILSLGLFMSTWPVPVGTPGAFFARGNTATCTAQGFVIQAGGLFTLYGACLAIYYVLVIRYNWTESRLRRLELASFVFIVLLALSTGVASIFLKLFNSATLWCWISPWPYGCTESRLSENGVGTCTRGDNAGIYRFVFFYAWLWLGLVVVIVCMLLVYWTVYKQAQQMEQYSSGGRLGKINLRLVAGQAKLYIFSFFAYGFFNSLTRIIHMINGRVYYPMLLLVTIFTPLQGVWNLLIYLRPRYLVYRDKNPDWSAMTAIRRALRRAVPICRSCRTGRNKHGGGDDEDDDDDDDDYMLGTIIVDETDPMGNT